MRTTALDHAYFKYVLRWAIEYNDGCNARRGLWMDRAVGDEEHQAWRHCGPNVARAFIEAKDIVTRKVHVIAEVNGQDFRFFQWLGVHATTFSGYKIQGVAERITGLKILGRDEAAEVFADGTVRLVSLSQDDLKFHFAAYGR